MKEGMEEGIKRGMKEARRDQGRKEGIKDPSLHISEQYRRFSLMLDRTNITRLE